MPPGHREAGCGQVISLWPTAIRAFAESSQVCSTLLGETSCMLYIIIWTTRFAIQGPSPSTTKRNPPFMPIQIDTTKVLQQSTQALNGLHGCKTMMQNNIFTESHHNEAKWPMALRLRMATCFPGKPPGLQHGAHVTGFYWDGQACDSCGIYRYGSACVWTERCGSCSGGPTSWWLWPLCGPLCVLFTGVARLIEGRVFDKVRRRCWLRPRTCTK